MIKQYLESVVSKPIEILFVESLYVKERMNLK